MKTTIIVIIILAVVAIGGYFIYSHPTNTSPAVSNTDNASSTNVTVTAATTTVQIPPVATKVSISIRNFAFSPATLNIKTGTKITWTNDDSVPHTVTSDSGTLLNSSTIAPGQSYSFTFSHSGSFSYHCAIHPMMTGTVVVTD